MNIKINRATLALLLQDTVLLGVLLSFVMHIFRAAERLKIIEIVPLEGGRYEERPAPAQLPGRQVVVLAPVGSTFMHVLTRYAASLQVHQGRLMLTGVSEPVYHQLEKTGLLAELGSENVYRATTIMGDSSRDAYQDALDWLRASEREAQPAGQRD